MAECGARSLGMVICGLWNSLGSCLQAMSVANTLPPGAGWLGGSKVRKKFVDLSRPQIPPSSTNFVFHLWKFFLMWVGRWGVGSAGAGQGNSLPACPSYLRASPCCPQPNREAKGRGQRRGRCTLTTTSSLL